MARDNFGFGKRQRELSKARKKEEKAQRKVDRQNADQRADATSKEPGDDSEAESDTRLSE